jgi:hypothetical protein
MPGRRDKRRYGATRALAALVVAVACLGGVAYAGIHRGRAEPSREKAGQRPPRPRFIEVPVALGVGERGQFRFHIPPRGRKPGNPAGPAQPASPDVRWRRFECRLDGGGWGGCSSPYPLSSLGPGDHSFAVRALNRSGRSGSVAHYRWSQLEPKDFTIEPLLEPLQELMPGAAPQQLPVQIENPNPAPIEVTGLTVVVSPDRVGCVADPNFSITPSSLSPAAALTVPAGKSVDLPTATARAPTLALRDLPFDQNACQGATLRLFFSGEARG